MSEFDNVHPDDAPMLLTGAEKLINGLEHQLAEAKKEIAALEDRNSQLRAQIYKRDKRIRELENKRIYPVRVCKKCGWSGEDAEWHPVFGGDHPHECPECGNRQ